MADGPLPEWRDTTCVVCPAQVLGLGCFDVVDGPGARYRRDAGLGYRTDAVSGVPVCVHPFRVGLAPGRYASGSERPQEAGAIPSAAMVELPEDVDDLEAWFVAVVRTADADGLADALSAAEAKALERFGGEQVVAALRRVLTYELA